MAHPSVALFVTCLVDQIHPEIGLATVRLLRRAGYQVEFPATQTCCGQPFFNSGFLPEARRLARRMIEVFEPFGSVVTPSGSCAAYLRAEMPHLFEGEEEWRQKARQLAAKTHELSEFLVHQAGWQPAPRNGHGEQPAFPERITYHDSCHMTRLLGLKEEPRRLLAAAGHQIDEMEESDRCCGFGGLFSLRMPEVSAAMGREKLRQAGGTGAPTLVTCDPGCMLRLRSLTDGAIRVEHLATVLDAAAASGESR